MRLLDDLLDDPFVQPSDRGEMLLQGHALAELHDQELRLVGGEPIEHLGDAVMMKTLMIGRKLA